MKTRFLSLALAVVMLLSMIPGAVFAESSLPMFGGVSITLTNSFAINFKIPEANVTDFGKVVFTNGEEVLGTVTTLPAVENGVYTFSYKNIAPHKMDLEVTATLYNSEETAVAQSKCSIETYCNTILANEGNKYGEELRMLAMEVLDYGAAAQKYVAAKAGSSVADADLVNNGISTSYTEIWTKSSSLVFDYNTDKVVGDALAEPAVKWTGVGLYLEDRISIRYKFTAESVEGLTMTAVSGDQTCDIEKFVKEEDYYLAYFSGLNPAQMREPVTVTMYKGDEAVSNSLTYSIESYVADAFTNADKTTKTLLQEMLYYGDAAEDYIVIAKKEEEAAKWSEVLSLPVTAETAIGSGAFVQQAATVTVDTTTGHDDGASIKVTSSGRLKVATSVSRTAGWYRFSGYVKLGTAQSSKLNITSWPSVSGVAPVFSISNADYPLFVGAPDENGWSYFYFDRYHAASDIFQLIINATGAEVYYDDIKYEKYLGEGQPPELETEEEQTPEWESQFLADFEDGNDGFVFRDKYNTVSENWGLAPDDSHNAPYRAGSNQVMRVGGNNRIELNKAFSANFDTTTYYKISGYVNLNGCSESLTAYIQAQGNPATGSNMLNVSFANSKVGKADAEGWQYFEIIYQYGAAYKTLILRLADKNNGTDIYFDNIEFSKYLGSDTLNPT